MQIVLVLLLSGYSHQHKLHLLYIENFPMASVYQLYIDEYIYHASRWEKRKSLKEMYEKC